MEVILKKLPNGALVPVSEEQAELLQSLPPGEGLRCDVKRMRNYKFLQKFHVLVGVLFDVWTETAPRLQFKGQEVAPNKERFRKDLQILCGFYEPVFGVRGELRLESKSISFARMGEDEFEKLFSQAINVGLGRILNRPDWTEEKVRAACEELLRFDR